MYIMNEKTGISFASSTANISEQRGGGYEGRVIQNTINLRTGLLERQKLVFTATATSRSKAQTVAARACKTLAENHAFMN